ncbi:MAG: hypothetical protein QM667_01155, partial [Asticcacaulis sp.]
MSVEASGSASEPIRKYDKGEGRKKHVGNKSVPTFKRIDHSPKHFIGLCPKGVPDDVRSKLLNSAVEDRNGDRELEVPKRLYAVYQGAIYEAQTSDDGTTYHAYPYRGKLRTRLVKELYNKAVEEKTETEFANWC